MIILNASNKTLEVVLAGAVATNALPVVANWIDVLSTDQSVSAFGESDGVATGTGAYTILSAPGVGHTRTLKSLTIHNADTTGATVTVRLNNGITTRKLVNILLSVGDTLEYIE